MTQRLDEDTIALCRQLRDKRAEASKVKKDTDDLRDQVLTKLNLLGTDVGVTASGAPVTHIEIGHRTYVDSKKLQAKYPAIYEECSEERETVTVKIDIED